MDIQAMNEGLMKLYQPPSYRYPKYQAGPHCVSTPLKQPTWDCAADKKKGVPDYQTANLSWWLEEREVCEGYDEDSRHGIVRRDDQGQWWWYSFCPPWMDHEKCASMEEGMEKADRHYAEFERGY